MTTFWQVYATDTHVNRSRPLIQIGPDIQFNSTIDTLDNLQDKLGQRFNQTQWLIHQTQTFNTTGPEIHSKSAHSTHECYVPNAAPLLSDLGQGFLCGSGPWIGSQTKLPAPSLHVTCECISGLIPSLPVQQVLPITGTVDSLMDLHGDSNVPPPLPTPWPSYRTPMSPAVTAP